MFAELAALALLTGTAPDVHANLGYRAATACDRLAGHPSDPDKVTDGVTQAAIMKAGVDAAIAACQEAAKDGSARANYQLGRVLTYAGRIAEANAPMETAVSQGYTQALFVRGLTLITGQAGRTDACAGGAMMHRSAVQGRSAGMAAFTHYALLGTFSACPGVKVDKAELKGFVAAARKAEPGDYFRSLLYDQLNGQIDKMP